MKKRLASYLGLLRLGVLPLLLAVTRLLNVRGLVRCVAPTDLDHAERPSAWHASLIMSSFSPLPPPRPKKNYIRKNAVSLRFFRIGSAQ